ncbi:type-F conjugative transfer system secretin TraK [Burkholderia territorii]|uniref:TraK domain-containing protein n=1 Tax=Burkholderia territorii TaxID=1503055 RepID=UPI0018C7684D|nr:type-F conjugative transfer system secretin TraK [Burkholderia territorii]
MTKTWTRLLPLLLLSAMATCEVASAKPLDLVPGQSTTIDISARSLTRFSVIDGKIVKLQLNAKICEGEVKSSPGDAPCDLVMTKDDQQGTMLVRPLAPKPLDGFLTLSSGVVYTVRLQPTDIPLESYEIRERKAPSLGQQLSLRSGPTATSLERSIKRLVVAMARGEAVQGAQYTPVNQVIPTDRDVQVTLISRIAGEQMIGDLLSYRNKASVPVDLREQDFFSPGVAAVGLEKTRLAPGEIGQVYVIRYGMGSDLRGDVQ